MDSLRSRTASANEDSEFLAKARVMCPKDSWADARGQVDNRASQVELVFRPLCFVSFHHWHGQRQEEADPGLRPSHQSSNWPLPREFVKPFQALLAP
jgi:hypothetical protein